MRARLGSVSSLVAAVLSGCLVIAPLDEPSPGGTGGTAGKVSGGGSGGTGGTSAEAGAGGDQVSSGGASATGGMTARGGTTGKGGGGAVSGDAGSGDQPAAGTGVGGALGGDECSTNEECVKLGRGEPYFCRQEDHTCVVLNTNDCPLVYGDFSHPNPIYFGSFGLLNDSHPDRNVTVWSSLLALEDINAAGGLPVGENGELRPLVMVVCNSNEDAHPGIIDRGMNHLANDVRVQALLATLRPADLQRSFQAHLAKKVFFLSPISLTSTLTDAIYPKGELIWNLLGQPSDFAPAYAKLLGHLEAYVRKARLLAKGTPIKVALVTTTDEFDADLQSFVFPALRFNGNKTASQNGDNFLNVELDAQSPDIEKARADIIEFNPDVIVSAAGDVMTQQGGLIGQIEATWAQTFREDERPYFILSPYNAGDLNSILPILNGIDGPAAMAEHFLGITAASAIDPTLQNAYALRLRNENGNDVNVDTGNYFDAVYTLAYAMVAAHADLTGPNIAAAMPSLLEGEPFGTRPEEIEDTLAWLAVPNQTIALSGTLGPPDYDPQTGVRAATPSVFCFSFQGVLNLEDQVLRYDREHDVFTGSYPCIDNFAP